MSGQDVICCRMQMMKPSSNPPPLVAVDAPSGWHVENGDESGLSLASVTSLQHRVSAQRALAQPLHLFLLLSTAAGVQFVLYVMLAVSLRREIPSYAWLSDTAQAAI